ncbi:MAG TPA: hypothetical protein VJ276_09510 [Thermoanaerobaculia bacterium]|nr:hypothetical protein [Thermoanaerobaculia bacterium]
MARTTRIALLLSLMIFAAGCGLADRARIRLARLMTAHIFAITVIHEEAVLTQSTFHKNDVVAAPRNGGNEKKAKPVARHERQPQTITGPIQLASLRLPLATAGVRSESILCVTRARLQQPRERVFRRYVVVTGSAPTPSAGG